jgi:hypothetical protein
MFYIYKHWSARRCEVVSTECGQNTFVWYTQTSIMKDRAWPQFLFLNSPPTFKTATPTSRTQLKLQLMREQSQQQERREAELRQQQLERRVQPLTAALKVPVSIQSVDVPPQVLQVSTCILSRTRKLVTGNWAVTISTRVIRRLLVRGRSRNKE